MDVRARFHDDDTSAYNTIAEIPGSTDGIVIAGAHLDSWHAGTGATDNAAGCAVAMEAVRILKALGVRPRRTIRIGLWSGEEQGLLGSRAHVTNHFATIPVSEDPEQQDLPVRMRSFAGEVEPKADHAKFSAYFNLDNGSGKIRGIWSQENAAATPIFEAWLAPFHDLGAGTVTTRNTRGTDHQVFDRVGLPGFQFIQDGLDYWSRTHHTNMDVLDHAEREDLVQASIVLASFLYHAANRDQPIPRKPMPRYEP
jgi:Zn-dependent M28 family amino/carboxypeptidase